MIKDAAVGTVVWYASLKITRDITVAYIGVPVNVLIACALGAFCSFSFAEKVDSRRQLWGLFVACMLMGAAFTAIVNAALVHWWELVMTDALHAGLGAAVSFVTRFFLPWLVDVVKHGKWLLWIPFLNRGDK